MLPLMRVARHSDERYELSHDGFSALMLPLDEEDDYTRVVACKEASHHYPAAKSHLPLVLSAIKRLDLT